MTEGFVPHPISQRQRSLFHYGAVKLFLVALLFGYGFGAAANPQDGVVSGGAAVISSSGKTLTVNQSTDKAVIDWRSFNIESDELTKFQQPNSSSMTLNRVSDINPSHILGQLSANGHVILINPNGVFFGQNSRVDVSGLVATTANISNSDFMAGHFNFNQPGNPNAQIINQGTITAKEAGLVGFVAPYVENSGTIQATLGKISLASGDSFTLDMAGDHLIEVAVSGDLQQQVVHNSGTLKADGGVIELSAAAARSVVDSVINNEGVIQANSFSEHAGEINLTADQGRVLQTGTIKASGGSQGGRIKIKGSKGVVAGGKIEAKGAHGGSISLEGADQFHYGSIDASGTGGDGGSITLNATNSIQQTSSASFDVSGTGNGGSIWLDTGAAGMLYSSALFNASGSNGGSITLLGQSLTLASATANASGMNEGGTIRIGGGFQGGEGLAQSTTVNVNPETILDADATVTGNGGSIAVWSSGDTQFYGNLTAKGGANSGNGGSLEVSGTNLIFGGNGDASAAHGQRGSLLLDPKNLTIDDNASETFQAGDFYSVLGNAWSTLLDNGNTIIRDYYATVMGVTDAGYINLYDPHGALISSLFGTHAEDQIGSGITLLSNGNYVAYNSAWNSNTGAVTWISQTTGANGPVTSANSLVGDNPGDNVGASVYNLSNGNYLAVSPDWNNSTGAVTWADGTAPLTGHITSGNSLLGAAPGDYLGNQVFVFANHNYLVTSLYNNGAGSLTFGCGSSSNLCGHNGVSGVVSSANSLVGTDPTDMDWFGYNELYGQNFYNIVITNAAWNNLTGAVTWMNGDTGQLSDGSFGGVISASNSVIGTHANDEVGAHIILSDGWASSGHNTSFVIANSFWDNNTGAVTWVDSSNGHLVDGSVGGAVSASNSLVGSNAGDQVGALVQPNGTNYLFSSSAWNNNAGAATWMNGANGHLSDGSLAGAVSASNSLIGANPNDQVGAGGDILIGFNNFIVDSPQWNNVRGALTWMNGSNGQLSDGSFGGFISAGNSLVGTYVGDTVGGYTVGTDASNVISLNPLWNNTVGAITWINASNGHLVDGSNGGEISISNSLLGSNVGDQIGNNGYSTNGTSYLIVSSNASSTSSTATWINASNGRLSDGSLGGYVSTSNSVISADSGNYPYDGRPTTLMNGNYLFQNYSWNNDFGADTWINGSNGQLADGTFGGNVSAANSRVGSHANDLGQATSSIELPGLYVIDDFQWNSNTGAIIAIDTVHGSVGVIDDTNSLVGDNPGDEIGSWGLHGVGSNNFVVASSNWHSNTGAVTWSSGANPITGHIDSSNSLIGSNPGDQVGGNDSGTPVLTLANGNYVVVSPYWNNNTGAVTLMNGNNGQMINGAFGDPISSSNSLIGANAGDTYCAICNSGPNGAIYISGLNNSNYAFEIPTFDNDTGSLTAGDGVHGITGVISSANSLIGVAAAYHDNGDGTGRYNSPNFNAVLNNGFIYTTTDDNNITTNILYNPNILAYGARPGTDVSMHTSHLTDVLNTGTDLTLQANNDITINSDITVNNSGGDGGTLTMQAGRSILLNANITTDNGNLNLYANDILANGVVDADRATGTAAITMADGTSIDAGHGLVNIELRNGAGKTHHDGGDITATNITAGGIVINNFNNDGDVIVNGNLTTSGIGSAATHATLGSYRNITLNGTAQIATASAGKLNVTLDSDANADGSGAIFMDTGSSIVSHGGDIVLGGGANPLTDSAFGDDAIGPVSQEGGSVYTQGINLEGATLNAGGGNISLIGTTVSNDAADSTAGIIVDNSTLQTSGNGTITIKGIGGTSSGNYASGLDFYTSSATTEAGFIHITGDASASSDAGSTGVGISYASVLSSTSGAITITGTGGQGSAGYYQGTYISGTVQTDTGPITINGYGGNGTDTGGGAGYNYGIFLDSPSLISSVKGAILLTGVGGNGGPANDGIHAADTTIRSTGTGSDAATITMNGTGGDSDADGGTGINLSGVTLESHAGAIYLGGLGGVGDYSQGITFGGSIASTSGAITLHGVGKNGVTVDACCEGGIYMSDAAITSQTGDITLYGEGAVGGPYDTGIFITGNSSISSTGTGANAAKIILTGIAGAGTGDTDEDGNGDDGIYFAMSGISSVDGNITLTGTGAGTGDNNIGVQLDGTASIAATGTGKIKIEGTGAAGAPGVQIDSIYTSTPNTISSAATGTAITIYSHGNFVNDDSNGDNSYSTPNGRWLIYSTNPTNDTLGDLSADFLRYSCAFGGSCPSITGETGKNGFLYSYTPTLVATAHSATASYGDAVPTLTYTFAGYLSTADRVADSLTGSSGLSTNYTQGSNAGTYNITSSGAALASALGYNITTYNGLTGGLTVGKKNITAAFTGNLTKLYGDANPNLDYSNFSFNSLVGSDNASLFTSITPNFGSINMTTAAGTYAGAVSATIADTANYHITNTPYTSFIVTSLAPVLSESIARQISVPSLNANYANAYVNTPAQDMQSSSPQNQNMFTSHNPFNPGHQIYYGSLIYIDPVLRTELGIFPAKYLPPLALN